MPVYYFDASGNCKFCELQNPTGVANNSGLTAITAASALNGGEIGYLDLQKVWNIGGVVKSRNDVTLKAESTSTSGQLKITVLSAEYFPVKIWIGENYYGGWQQIDIPSSTPVYYNFHDQNITYAQVRDDFNRIGRNYQVTVCVCYSCDCGSSCFIPGTKILMWDRSTKNIEDVVVGDKVVGMNGDCNTVYGLYNTMLGNHRVIHTLRNHGIYFSGEHFFWIKDKGHEGWGVHNYSEYIWEKRHPEMIPNHLDVTKPEPFIITDSVEYATLDGWKRDKFIIDRSFPSNTALYTLRVDGDHTHYANGIVVEGLANIQDFDYSSLTFNGRLK